MTGRLVATNGVELWVEVDGDLGESRGDRGDDGRADTGHRDIGGRDIGDDDRTVILLGGADASVLRWPRTFIDPLVADRFATVRIEHRDCGLSSKISADDPYRLDDMARDVVGVIDALGVRAADVVGYSMGGAVAQVLALEHPERVRSLTLVATTPGLGDERLPFAADWFVEKMAERLFAPPPRSFDDRVAWTVDLYRMLAGSRYPFDDSAQVELARAEVERCWYPESGHGVAANASPTRIESLRSLRASALVVHGTEDPVYAIEHAQALADAIPESELVVVDGLGHEVPEAFGAELADLVLRFISAGRRSA